MVHIPVPANVGCDGRSQMPPMLPYAQPQLQQPQQPQLLQSQLHQAGMFFVWLGVSYASLPFQACFGGPVWNSRSSKEHCAQQVSKVS
jgi:hypothetical protein